MYPPDGGCPAGKFTLSAFFYSGDERAGDCGRASGIGRRLPDDFAVCLPDFVRACLENIDPLLCIYLALCIIVPVAPFLHLEQVTGGIKSVVCWGLGILTTIFVGMLSIQTIVGSGGDSLMLKTSKFLVGSFIPVIGGTISDAVGAAKGCVQVLKSVVGSFGILVAVLSFLPALLEVCLWYLAVRVLAWVGLMLDAKEVSSLLSSIAQTFSILLAMIGCFMLLVLVSTTLMLMMTVG